MLGRARSRLASSRRPTPRSLVPRSAGGPMPLAATALLLCVTSCVPSASPRWASATRGPPVDVPEWTPSGTASSTAAPVSRPLCASTMRSSRASAAHATSRRSTTPSRSIPSRPPGSSWARCRTWPASTRRSTPRCRRRRIAIRCPSGGIGTGASAASGSTVCRWPGRSAGRPSCWAGTHGTSRSWWPTWGAGVP